VKTSPKGVQLAEVGPRFELKRTFQGVFVINDWTYLFPQLMKSDWVQLSSPKLSGNGYSRIIRERQESVACCQILGHHALTMTNKPTLGLPRSAPADKGVVGYKGRSLITVTCHAI
jgi:hypothetical protein